uniref:Variant surface glycoprotein 1125.4683 n=1 Tax=Trypanosoma brucei TaxID=5691 RepID=A0A1J0RAV9_9TRYP|nr:variant surface glycoprotein 1125.4683 [Trypanosoma brucei]
MCRLYKLLSIPITIPGLTISLRSDSTESANQITLGILDRAQKINMSVAKQLIVEVLTNTDKYKNKAAVDGDAAKKGYFNLKDDAELEKMRSAYKEVLGAQGAEKAFSKKYGRALEEKQRQLLRPAMSNLYQNLANTAALCQDLEAKLRQTIATARVHMGKALYGTKYAATPTDLLSSTGPLSNPTAANFPWPTSADRKTACAKPDGDDSTKAGNALATDVVCICIRNHSTGHDMCAAGISPAEANFAASRSPANAEEAFEKIVAKCKPGSEKITLLNIANKLTAAVQAVYARMDKNGITAAAANGGPNGAAKRFNFYGITALGGAAPGRVATGATTHATAGEGVCIDYSAYLKPTKGIPWINNIEAAAAELKKGKELFTELNRELAKAVAQERQMKTLPIVCTLLTPAVTTAPTETKYKKPTVEEQNKCKLKNTIAEECPSKHCNYDDTKKQCKAKPGT